MQESLFLIVPSRCLDSSLCLELDFSHSNPHRLCRCTTTSACASRGSTASSRRTRRINRSPRLSSSPNWCSSGYGGQGVGGRKRIYHPKLLFCCCPCFLTVYVCIAVSLWSYLPVFLNSYYCILVVYSSFLQYIVIIYSHFSIVHTSIRWHGVTFETLRSCLENKEWTSRRNALTLLTLVVEVSACVLWTFRDVVIGQDGGGCWGWTCVVWTDICRDNDDVASYFSSYFLFA